MILIFQFNCVSPNYDKDLNLRNNLDNHLRIHITFKDKFGKEEKQDFMISFYEVPANGIGKFSTFERKFIIDFTL